MQRTFNIEIYGQTLRVTGNYYPYEEGDLDNPNQKEYFECEKIEIRFVIDCCNFLGFGWKDISQFIS